MKIGKDILTPEERKKRHEEALKNFKFVTVRFTKNDYKETKSIADRLGENLASFIRRATLKTARAEKE